MTKVNDGRVEQFIAWSFKVAATQLSEEGMKNQVMLVQAAWLALKANRRTSAYQGDYDCSAAEHYMFARYMAGSTGDPIVQIAPTLYDIKKIYKFAMGEEKSMRTDPDHPTLSPDSGVWKWGNKGAQDGLKNYKSRDPNAKYNYGTSVKSFAQDAGFSKDAAQKVGSYAEKVGSVGKH